MIDEIMLVTGGIFVGVFAMTGIVIAIADWRDDYARNKRRRD